MQIFRDVSGKLDAIPFSPLPNERALEDWIVSQPDILDLDAVLVCRQAYGGDAGIPDLMFLDETGCLHIVELKRDKAPREVLAQVLEYGAWADTLSLEDVASLFKATGEFDTLEAAFSAKFAKSLQELETLSCKMLVCASSLDPRTERVIRYLITQCNVPIRSIFFKSFQVNDEWFLVADWLLDVDEEREAKARANKSSRKQGVWTGYYYINAGPDPNIEWEDNRKHGYVGAGGGLRYSNQLRNSEIGDEVFVYRKGVGYVGAGVVAAEAVPPTQFLVDGVPICETGKAQHRCFANEPEGENANWVLPITWHQTVSETEAKRFKGIFSNQAIRCRLFDGATSDYLKRELGLSEVAAKT